MFFLIRILKNLKKIMILSFFFFSIQILKPSISFLKNRVGWGEGLPSSGGEEKRSAAAGRGGGGGFGMGSGDGGSVAARWELRGYLKSEMTSATGEFFPSSSSLKSSI